MLEGTNIHGQLVRLGSEASHILERQPQASALTQHLGHLLALTAAIYGSQKHGGMLALGIHGKGAVSKLLADARLNPDESAVSLRAMVGIDDSKPLDDDPNAGLISLLQEGYMMLTLDPPDGGERSQGIVALTDDWLENAIDEYFFQSAQEKAFCKLAASAMTTPATQRNHQACCLLIKQMPPQQLENHAQKLTQNDDWEWAHAVLETLTQEELLDIDLGSEMLLNRLFHEKGVRVFDPIHFVDQCNCNSKRMLDALITITPEARASLKSDRGLYEMTCLFCKRTHDFNDEDIHHYKF